MEPGPVRAMPGICLALGSHQVEALVAALKDIAGNAEHLELDTRIWSKKPLAERA